jgi:septum formation topological specificity factor MinE
MQVKLLRKLNKGLIDLRERLRKNLKSIISKYIKIRENILSLYL